MRSVLRCCRRIKGGFQFIDPATDLQMLGAVGQQSLAESTR
jgi:hypothetical protein